MANYTLGALAAPDIVQRPPMRRKSSAQNLLSSFKSSPTPPPISIGPISATAPSFGGASTPTTMTPREWDSQSMHSDNPVIGTSASPALPQGTSVEYLRDLVQKRIITLTYMRNIHEGCAKYMWFRNSKLMSSVSRRSHWFHTILMSRTELDKVFNNTDMKKR
jgi:hypothetical protein